MKHCFFYTWLKLFAKVVCWIPRIAEQRPHHFSIYDSGRFCAWSGQLLKSCEIRIILFKLVSVFFVQIFVTCYCGITAFCMSHARNQIFICTIPGHRETFFCLFEKRRLKEFYQKYDIWQLNLFVLLNVAAKGATEIKGLSLEERTVGLGHRRKQEAEKCLPT